MKHFDYLGCFVYHVNICTFDRHSFFRDDVTAEKVKTILFETAFQSGFDLLYFCLMPDHLHLLCAGTKEDASLKSFISLFKQKSGFWFGRTFGRKLWQKSYYEHVLRGEEDVYRTGRYILENPVRKGIVADYRDYGHSWSKYFDVGEGESFL